MMSTIGQTKEDRINLRLKQDAKLKLERAASFEGKSVSKFILSCALDRAEQTIKKHDAMSLNAEDSETFFTALSAPITFNDSLIAAFKEHDLRVTSK